MKAVLFVEGGGTGSARECRRAFVKLLVSAGFDQSKLDVIACGSRGNVFRDFQKRCNQAGKHDFVCMLIDSEGEVSDSSKPWIHLRQQDNWVQPSHVENDQVFLMTRCMEAWLLADVQTLKEHYSRIGQKNLSSDPDHLETISPKELLKTLLKATEKCSPPYSKGEQSFLLLAKINPIALKQLGSYDRMERILKNRLIS
ncbi:MAG: DUF4276 family protein [Candidatus Methylacidiphilales bacterium]